MLCGSETCYLNWLEIIIDAFINMLSFCKLRNSLQYLLISVEFIGVIIVFFSGYELVYRYLLWVITSHALNYLLSLCAIVFEIAMELPFCIEMLKTKKLQIWTGFVKALSFFPLLCFVWYSSRPRCYILYMASILRGSPRNIGSHAWYLFAWPVFVILVFLIFLILILLKLDL